MHSNIQNVGAKCTVWIHSHEVSRTVIFIVRKNIGRCQKLRGRGRGYGELVFKEDRVSVSFQFSSVQFSHSVMSESLRPHELQHARPPCPSPTPGVHSDSCSSSRWCHPAISSSVIPFSSCPQSLSASASFPMSQLFSWGGQSTGVSALASFLPKKSQGWCPSEWTVWISLQSKWQFRKVKNSTDAWWWVLQNNVNVLRVLNELYS